MVTLFQLSSSKLKYASLIDVTVWNSMKLNFLPVSTPVYCYTKYLKSKKYEKMRHKRKST